MITVRAGSAKNSEAPSSLMKQLLTGILKSVKLLNYQDESVFCNREGMPFRSFSSAFERAMRKVGIVGFTVYDLR
jgi:hypothetical protein